MRDSAKWRHACSTRSSNLVGEPRRVLIAERDERVREFQKYFLDREGMSVEFVSDGEAALEAARQSRPDVIVTEILIPKVDGLSLCRKLGEDPLTCGIPVIIFSILAAEARAGEAGAKAFVRKPLVESVFVAAIRDVMGAPSKALMEQQ